MILTYSSYSKLVYDVTTGHMTLRFEIFWRETANWQEGNMQVWSGMYTIEQNLVTLQHYVDTTMHRTFRSVQRTG